MEISVNDGDETVINFQRAKCLRLFRFRMLPTYLPHWMCVYLHSIISSGVILGGHKIKQKTRKACRTQKCAKIERDWKRRKNKMEKASSWCWTANENSPGAVHLRGQWGRRVVQARKCPILSRVLLRNDDNGQDPWVGGRKKVRSTPKKRHEQT